MKVFPMLHLMFLVLSLMVHAAIVNMLRPGTAKTFQDYAADVFRPYINTQLQYVTRLDIVWDRYVEESLKTHARSKRGIFSPSIFL